jgi:transposase
LRAGSQIVQQQALRDFTQAMANFFAGTHGKPSWRKAGRDEGFRIVAVKPDQVRRLSRKIGEVWIPKAGWTRFRWSRPVPSQRCSACGHIAADSRESQALFRCVACGYACNADVNAAKNIAAGHAVTARGGFRITGPVNREPELFAALTGA